MTEIPEHFVHTRATPFWTKDNTPQSLLMPHNNNAGVYGRISVMQGAVKVFHFSNSDMTTPEKETTISAGAFEITAPQHWQRIEIIDPDTYFNIDFFSDPAIKLVGAGLSKVLSTDTGSWLKK